MTEAELEISITQAVMKFEAESGHRCAQHDRDMFRIGYVFGAEDTNKRLQDRLREAGLP